MHYRSLETEKRSRRTSLSIQILIFSILPVILYCLSGVDAAFSGRQNAPLPPQFHLTRGAVAGLEVENTLTKGTFLVASRRLRDPNFSQTVVLLIDYDSYGATGVVINRPSEVKVSTILPEVEGIGQQMDTLYLGGPVAPDHMLLLVRSLSEPEESRHIFEDVYVSSSKTVLQRVIEKSDGGTRFRVYAGHAGWAPGQLEQEVSRGSWHVLRADVETVFDKSPSQIWPEMIQRSSMLLARL